jgi:hypothetical protein
VFRETERVQTGEAGTGSMVVRKGYGNECSLMIATKASDYHTKPHVHESEQINYLMECEIWFSSINTKPKPSTLR